MRLRHVVPVTLLLTFGLITPAIAENPDHLQQLLDTRACANCDLVNADLRQTHLIGADLRNADLTGANLTEANLEGADLTGANLTDANLTEAFLTNAVLDKATLINTDMTDTTLIFTQAHGVEVKDVILTGADIYHTPIFVGGPER